MNCFRFLPRDAIGYVSPKCSLSPRRQSRDKVPTVYGFIHSFIFVYKRLSYATNDRNMLTSNKEKCPLIWRTININTSVCRAAE